MNLDAKINEVSYKLADDVKDKKKSKNDLENSIGILANDGVYAFYVYCDYQKIWAKISNSLSDLKNYLPKQPAKLNQQYFQNLADNLTDLLFVKDILDKILTYTRYHLKAMGDEK